MTGRDGGFLSRSRLTVDTVSVSAPSSRPFKISSLLIWLDGVGLHFVSRVASTSVSSDSKQKPRQRNPQSARRARSRTGFLGVRLPNETCAEHCAGGSGSLHHHRAVQSGSAHLAHNQEEPILQVVQHGSMQEPSEHVGSSVARCKTLSELTK